MARPLLPAVRRIGPLASLDELRQAVDDLQEFVQTREPLESGDPLNKYLTLRAAVESGIVIYRGPGGGGSGGTVGIPPPAPPLDWDDLTPPDPITTLTVDSIPTGFFIQFDPPTYRQGGGNAYSIIYRANYSGAGPLPTFGDSAECGRCTARNPILIIAAEPGTISHFWAQPVSHAEDFQNVTPQTSPTGGTNGVSQTAGQLNDDHIAELSAGKLTAGAIAVGEYIEAAGYDPGVYGWRINGGGSAEFNDLVLRGTIYATAGLIGGAIIDADGIESDNYVASTSGWRLDNATGKVFAYDVVLYGEFEGIVTLPAFSASIDEGSTFIDSRSNGRQTYDTFNVTVTGGKSPFVYQWVLSQINSDNDTAPIGIFITTDPTADNISVSGLGTDNVVIGYISCLVTDSDQRVCKTGFAIAVTHGTPP